jgi:hypothetical protein
MPKLNLGWICFIQHGSISATSLCTLKHIRDYFREGVMPPKGKVCEIEDEMFPTGSKVKLQEDVSQEEYEVLRAWRELSSEFELPRLV